MNWIKKIIRPSDLQEKLIIATEMNIFTYNNLDKYMYDSRIGKKISSEFTFNPNVFATGKKEAITRLFGNIEKATYGELEISFINGQSTLNHLSSSKIRYISQFQNHTTFCTDSIHSGRYYLFISLFCSQSPILYDKVSIDIPLDFTTRHPVPFVAVQ